MESKNTNDYKRCSCESVAVIVEKTIQKELVKKKII